MSNELSQAITASFRVYHGKLFAVLLRQFGSSHVFEVEDAIQNAFLKALKTWRLDQLPDHQEKWLYVVARNDLLNQLRKANRSTRELPTQLSDEIGETLEDIRLKTILFLCQSPVLSRKLRVVFVLKNIFGLSVAEISRSTLLGEEAIYKNVNRAKRQLLAAPTTESLEAVFVQATATEISAMEEVLYAVFTIGFDTFDAKNDTVFNEALCLEALALTKLLWQQFKTVSTGNLLALFCFHLARVPAKLQDNCLVPFFQQDRTQWDAQLLELGFHYLQQPVALNRYYLEALITSKYMTTKVYDRIHWQAIAQLYRYWLQMEYSPLIVLNLSYCLSKAGDAAEAQVLLKEATEALPKGHVYLGLVTATILRNQDLLVARKLIVETLTDIQQPIRRDYVLTHLLN